MKETDLANFKKLLTDQLTELTKGVDRAVSGIKEGGEGLVDPLDRASFDAGQAMHLRIKSRESNLIRKIEDALERIEEGTYGICESCGKDIPVKRMMVRPVTSKCIACKTKEESWERVAEL